MPRLRQAVLAARDLEPVVARLQREYGLGEPYRDPEVGSFGLANAVFAIGDTFLEVISPLDPTRPGAGTADRRLERSGASVCGYMAMLQVGDLAAARARAQASGIREVFAVQRDDIAEVHLHPADLRGALVAISRPRPPAAWRWGGPGWLERAIPGAVTGVTIAEADPELVATRWSDVAGGPLPECRFIADERAPGIVEITLELNGEAHTLRPDRL